MTVRLTGAMSMRQNDFGGASSATRIAARITAGCVTATSRVRRVGRSTTPASRAPGRSGRRPTRRRAAPASGRSARWPDRRAAPRRAPRRATAAVQIGQPRLGAGVQAEQFGGLPGALLGSAKRAVALRRGRSQRVDLAAADRVERFVGGKSSGCHRVGHARATPGSAGRPQSRRDTRRLAARPLPSSRARASRTPDRWSPTGPPVWPAIAAGTRRGRRRETRVDDVPAASRSGRVSRRRRQQHQHHQRSPTR